MNQRRWSGVLLALVAFLVLGVTTVVGLVEWRSRRRFDAPTPAMVASAEPATISEGRYLVYSAAACAYCHVPKEQWVALDRGDELPLTGHHIFRLPFGVLYSPNITPDATTGIGRRRDGELARILRHGVRADGRAAFPMMEYQDISDADLTAILSYLRARPAVAHDVPDHELSFVGKAIMAFAIEPGGPSEAAPAVSEASPSEGRGRYLANVVSMCVTCHTDRGEDGALVGPRFGGGQRMDVAADATKVYVSPNLTPDPATSPIGQWSEDAFVARFRMGEQTPGTPMPWGAFARLREDDLRSLYRYFRTLPPVVNQTGPPVQAKGE